VLIKVTIVTFVLIPTGQRGGTKGTLWLAHPQVLFPNPAQKLMLPWCWMTPNLGFGYPTAFARRQSGRSRSRGRPNGAIRGLARPHARMGVFCGQLGNTAADMKLSCVDPPSLQQDGALILGPRAATPPHYRQSRGGRQDSTPPDLFRTVQVTEACADASIGDEVHRLLLGLAAGVRWSVRIGRRRNNVTRAIAKGPGQDEIPRRHDHPKMVTGARTNVGAGLVPRRSECLQPGSLPMDFAQSTAGTTMRTGDWRHRRRYHDPEQISRQQDTGKGEHRASSTASGYQRVASQPIQLQHPPRRGGFS
jgi:hypothetical protein